MDSHPGTSVTPGRSLPIMEGILINLIFRDERGDKIWLPCM